MADTAKVVFTPSGRQGRVAAGSTILEAARALGVDLDSICGGRGKCGRCQVRLGSTRSISLDPERLSVPGPTETDYRGRRALTEGMRLGCAAHILSDVVIDVPIESRLHRQVVRKRPELTDAPVDPVVRLYYVEMEPPVLAHPAGALRRLQRALGEQWGLGEVEPDPFVLADIQPALHSGEWAVTVAVHDERHLSAIWPGFHDLALGAAFDVGSTTIACHLCDLASGEILATTGVMNPQVRFGEDVMSRVSYVMMNDDGAAELTSVVRGALRQALAEVTARAGVHPHDVLEVSLVGNPIMHHLALGIDPTPLGTAPFSLATDGAVRWPASQLELGTHPGARLYVLPCVAGHVGADAAGAVLAEGPHRGTDVQLLVDVGTNAEIVLGNEEQIMAASSPTGPAFEGAQISSGQRAAPGAIERVRVDRDSLEPRFQIIGCERWSDEAGFDSATSETGVTGICGSGIIEAIAELFLAGVIDRDGVIQGPTASARLVEDGRTWSYVLHAGPPRILITQNDVRAIQLAKAALDAGIRLLMDHLGVDSVDEIRLAGAFGSHIDPKYAMTLGMIPDCDLDRVSAAGNAAGDGAIMALLSGRARSEIEDVVTSIEKIETATEPKFQEMFIAAMAIPHSTASFPYLAEVVRFPPRRTVRRTKRSQKVGPDNERSAGVG